MSYASWKALRELLDTSFRDLPRKYPFLLAGSTLLIITFSAILFELSLAAYSTWLGGIGLIMIFIDLQYPKKMWW